MISKDAIDIIEQYGADAKRWPKAQVADIRAAVAADPAVKEALVEQRKLDKDLANWEFNEDGAGYDEEQAPDNDDDKNDDDQDGSSETPGGATDAPEAAGFDNKDDKPVEDEEPKEDVVLSADDLAKLVDADEMLGDFISSVASSAIDDWFVFTKDYDKCEKFPARGHSPERLDKAVAASTGPLQKNLQRLIMARSRAKMTPGFRSGKLHGASLHRLMAGDDRLFRRRQEAKALDTAISLVIDCSGSMNAQVGHGGKNRIQLALESAYAMAQVLSKIDVDFEIIGFTNENCTVIPDRAEQVAYYEELQALVASGVTVSRYYPLVHHVFKEFSEPFNPAIAKRLATAHAEVRSLNMSSNTDGESLRFCAERLQRVAAERRIMIVLSDGEPACPEPMYPPVKSGGYHPSYDGDFAEKDLVRSVKAIEKSGIEVVAMGMGFAGVKSFYKNSEVVMNIGQLPEAIMKQLKALLV